MRLLDEAFWVFGSCLPIVGGADVATLGASFVLGAMERRMAALGFSWADVTATQVYTIFEIHPLLADEFVRRGSLVGRFGLAFRAPAGAGP